MMKEMVSMKESQWVIISECESRSPNKLLAINKPRRPYIFHRCNQRIFHVQTERPEANIQGNALKITAPPLAVHPVHSRLSSATKRLDSAS